MLIATSSIDDFGHLKKKKLQNFFFASLDYIILSKMIYSKYWIFFFFYFLPRVGESACNVELIGAGFRLPFGELPTMLPG